ncbi:MAG: nucleotide exchange factor GrpE, partial [Candidatus Binatus sp.]
MTKRHKQPEDGNPAIDGGFDQADAGAESVHGEGSHSSAGSESELDSLRAQIAEKDKEIAELKDKYLRTLADSENARKRIRQQSEESIRIQREAILRDLLPIIDNLERALGA